MAITTTSAIRWYNPESQAILNYMAWARTNEQIIGEYFWLVKQAVYNDAWDKVIDMINDFKDPKALKAKWVHYVEQFKDYGITEEVFYNIIEREYVETKWNSPSTWSTKSKS